MPVFIKETAKTDSDDGLGNPCGPYRAILFSDSGGLTQFGAFEEILPPGASSSVKHWHVGEDEMVYVLQGEVTLYEGDESVVMRSGDAATFKAGVPIGHCLKNRSNTEARCLVIGTRSSVDVVTIPITIAFCISTELQNSAAGQIILALLLIASTRSTDRSHRHRRTDTER